MTELLIEWPTFKNKMNLLYAEGQKVNAINPKNQIEFDSYASDYNEWKNSVLDFLTKSFQGNNQYIFSFKSSNSNKFNLHVQSKPIEMTVKELKDDLKKELISMEYITNLLSVSDLIIYPNKVDISQRQNYTSEEILELILNKLYDLYDNNIYPILPILEGNGITLTKRREEYEYVNILEGHGYVISNIIGIQADAQLTVEGKMYIEQQRKSVKPNYQYIDDNQSDINAKIDELKKKLDKLGFGQEILFNELEEIKELFPKLSKKNFGQLLKGKIYDLVISQIINKDIAKMIYEMIAKEALKLF